MIIYEMLDFGLELHFLHLLQQAFEIFEQKGRIDQLEVYLELFAHLDYITIRLDKKIRVPEKHVNKAFIVHFMDQLINKEEQ